ILAPIWKEGRSMAMTPKLLSPNLGLRLRMMAPAVQEPPHRSSGIEFRVTNVIRAVKDDDPQSRRHSAFPTIGVTGQVGVLRGRHLQRARVLDCDRTHELAGC